MEKGLIQFLLLLGLVWVGASVSFKSLYDRELKSTYGFEILKHYHSEQFGDEDVKHFKGESMLFMTPWYWIIDAGEYRAKSFPLSI